MCKMLEAEFQKGLVCVSLDILYIKSSASDLDKNSGAAANTSSCWGSEDYTLDWPNLHVFRPYQVPQENT